MSNKQAKQPFFKYRQGLQEGEAEQLRNFFGEVEQHIALSAGECAKLRADFEAAFLWYAVQGISLQTALTRLAVCNLGGFYARPPLLWYPLDDAAKIYPLSMKHGQMSVFRLSVYLNEPVVPQLLQMALTFAIKHFPSFATTVKKGFFWHYLDASKRRYVAEPEVMRPLRPIRIAGSGSQSFRVLHYGNRISVEYFHVLTDGTGGMAFLQALTAEYLRLRHGVTLPAGAEIPDVNATPEPGETANAFALAERGSAPQGFVDKPALQMSGALAKLKPCRVLHFKLDAAALCATAKRKGATVTTYLLALLFVASQYATDETEGDISIQVPVNMRKFYPSLTLRNFSMYCGIRLPAAEVSGVDALLGKISAQLAEKASKQAMGEMLTATERMVGAVQYVPLFIKAPIASIAYGFLGDKIFSNTLSNLGVVTLPSPLAAHVESMDFVLNTCVTNRASCALVTFGNTATLSVSKFTNDPSFEEKLCELLILDGLVPVVEGSVCYEG